MKVCVIGIDGLTFDVLDPMIQAGHLPNFKSLKENAAWGTLTSTIPPHTPPAWMSIATGVRPAKHGIYDFWEFNWSSQRLEANLVTRRKAGRAIWEILSEYGKRVIVVNVPCTYPPDKVNGIMISGFSAPSLDSGFTYPSGYREELLRQFPNYQIDINQTVQDFGIDNENSKLEAVQRMTDVRVNLLDSYLKDNTWDFLFFTFVGADRLQHDCWDEIVSLGHPELIQYYEKIDAVIGRTRQSLGAQDWLLLVSDHGFHGSQHFIDLNHTLVELGLARPRLKSYFATPVARIADFLGIKNFLRKALTSSIQKDWVANVGANIDLNTSKCVAVNGDGFGLVFSRAALDERTLTAIAEHLVAQGIAKRSNVLWGNALETELGPGEFLAEGPKLAVISEPGWSFRSAIRLDRNIGIFPTRGAHAMAGVLMMSGPGVLPQHLPETSVVDITPSVLELFQLPQESQFDGKPMELLRGIVPGNTLMRDAMTGAVWDTAAASDASLADRLKALTDM